MAAKIITPIEESSFEIIRNRVALILSEELQNQSALLNDNDINAKIEIQRTSPIDISELPLINVAISELPLNDAWVANSNSTVIIDIDIYARKRSTPTDNSDTKSGILLLRLAGIISQILRSSAYYTLDFPVIPKTNKPFISSTKVKNFKPAEASKIGDQSLYAAGTLYLEVNAFEEHIPDEGIELDSSTVIFTLENTDKGHIAEFKK